MTDPRPHLSMLRSYTAADALTIANASCGTISLFLCLNYVETGSNRYIWLAFLLLPLALVFDILDGWVARAQPHRKSVLGFTLGMRGGWDMLCLTYFVVCGVSRLARFNVTAAALSDATTGKVKYFEGTPIPTSIAIVALLAAALEFGRIGMDLWFGAWRVGPATLHPLVLVYVASGSAMISATLRIPKP